MNKHTLLEQVEANVKVCKKCRLCETALNAVPGEGNMDAEVVFIGEAPGKDEDVSGRPFVGRAGKMLEAMLKRIDYTRDQVWIGNVIKHRPPQNRDPLPDEIAACEPYLTRQLQIIQPILIVTLGRFAMNYFYKDGKITRDHGRLIKLEHYTIYPLYHPAAALRKREFAEVLLKDFMEIPTILAELKEQKVSVRLENNDNPLGL